jgi:hypothetical protein
MNRKQFNKTIREYLSDLSEDYVPHFNIVEFTYPFHVLTN